MKVFYLFLLVVLSCQSYSTLKDSRLSEPINITEAISNTNINAIYLTWDTPDTSSTIVINYLATHQAQEPTLYLDTESHQGQLNKYEQNTTGSYREIARTPFHVFSFSVKNLIPDTTYFFVVGDEINGHSKELRFRTLPNDDSPIEFIQGGDMSSSHHVSKIAQKAVTNNTRAMLIGGDIAYANGSVHAYKRWQEWFDQMNMSTVTPDGHIIPLILAIGNHETNFSFKDQPLAKAPFYFSLFAQNALQPYFTRKLGNHSVVFTLDSGHIVDHYNQVVWLEKEMSNYRTTKNSFALYHVPLYPTHRSFNGALSKMGRKHWQPIFDKYNLTIGFENHDHALKRTKPIKNNTFDEHGTVYLGDGCWGVGTRSYSKQWYHEVAGSERHVWRIQASKNGVKGLAINTNGDVLDEFSILK